MITASKIENQMKERIDRIKKGMRPDVPVYLPPSLYLEDGHIVNAVGWYKYFGLKHTTSLNYWIL
jgi:hypothetical protein